MSNAGRPSLVKQHTRASEAKRDAANDLGIQIKVDGVEYTVREGDLTSLDIMALRRETGQSFVGLMQAFMSSPDIDLIAALVWLSRRIDGEVMLSYAEVATDIGYDVDVDIVGEAGEEENPEE